MPTYAIAYDNQGNALGMLNRREEALLAYEQAIRLDPKRARTYSNKGYVLSLLGRREESQQAYAIAQSLSSRQTIE